MRPLTKSIPARLDIESGKSDSNEDLLILPNLGHRVWRVDRAEDTDVDRRRLVGYWSWRKERFYFRFSVLFESDSIRKGGTWIVRCLHEILIHGPSDRRHGVLEIFSVTIEGLELVMDRCCRFICQLRRYGVPYNHEAWLVRHGCRPISSSGQLSGGNWQRWASLRLAKLHEIPGRPRHSSDS